MTLCKDVVTGRRVLYVDCSYNSACYELEQRKKVLSLSPLDVTTEV